MTSHTPNTTTHTLTEKATVSACGIRVRMAVIPPSAPMSSDEQIMLVASWENGPTPGEEPLPGSIAPARPDTTVTLLGRRFAIVTVSVGARRVTLRALC